LLLSFTGFEDKRLVHFARLHTVTNLIENWKPSFAFASVHKSFVSLSQYTVTYCTIDGFPFARLILSQKLSCKYTIP